MGCWPLLSRVVWATVFLFTDTAKHQEILRLALPMTGLVGLWVATCPPSFRDCLVTGFTLNLD